MKASRKIGSPQQSKRGMLAFGCTASLNSGIIARSACASTGTRMDKVCTFSVSLADVSLTFVTVDRKVWVVVIDGVTVGHPCCAVHNCHTPLANSRHQFCPVHLPTHGHICAIIGCNDPIVQGSLVCGDPEHQEVERIHRERGQARFQLKERLQRARVAHPNDVIADLVDADNVDDEFEIPGGHLTTNRKKLRAQFGRKRTHNEQIIVAPCGMIIARETFYGAEGIASVVVSCLAI
jgi:hypothetical protein